MNISKHLKKGQVLVMVLITMMVLGIIIVSTSSNLVKDIQSTQETNRYETLNAYAERMAFELGLEFANPLKNNFSISVFSEVPAAENASARLNTLLEESGWKTRNTCILKNDCYSCDIEFDSTNLPQFEDSGINTQITNPQDLKAVAKICDSKEIKNAEVYKDEILVYDLTGINKSTIESKNFQIDWEQQDRLRDIAMEVSIDFVYKVGTESLYGTTKAIYKPTTSSIFGANLNSENQTYIPFTNTGDSSFRFNLSNFESNLNNSNGYFKHLKGGTISIERYSKIRIRPVIKSNTPVAVKISVGTAETPPMDKVQGRTIEILVYEESQDVNIETGGGFRGSQALVISTVPAAKMSGLFDYILKNDNTL